MSSHTDRVVVLVDMDCFYCQVEERLDPNLAGKPIAVVQYNAWKGGGIIAVNYPARDRGVTRHMRGNEAKEKCPEIELVRVPNVRGKADLTKYREAGKRVAEVLQTFTPLLQRASVDEAYMDITEAVNKRIVETNKLTTEHLPNTHVVGCETKDFVYNMYNNDLQNESNLKLAFGGAIVEEIRAAVYEKTGYRCSAGIAHNKILAKLACGIHKPNKQTILPQDGVEELYKKLPLKKIKSLGGKFGASLSEDLNITYMGELIQFSERELQKKYDEKTAFWLYNIARGIDREPVEVRLVSKSIGCCKKFPGKTALVKLEDVTHWVSELATEISERLEQDTEENNRRAKSLTVSFAQPVNRKDVHSTRAQTLNSYDAKKIANDAFEILKKCAQKADGSFRLTFLGLNVGKFEDCKNMNSISTFFKPAAKTDNINITTVTQNSLNNKCEKLDSKNMSNISSFFKPALKNEENTKNINNISNFFKPTDTKKNNSPRHKDLNKSRKRGNFCENKEKIDNKSESNELNLDDIEEDAEQSSDIDLNKTFQDIQNIKCPKIEHEDEGSYSDSTVEEDFSEEINKRLEFPYVSEQYYPESENANQKSTGFGDTSKSFFMKYVKYLDDNTQKSVSPTTVEEKSNETTEHKTLATMSDTSENIIIKNEPETFIFDQPSCSYQPPSNNSAPIILYNENSNSSSIIDDIEKICPECNKKVHQYDYTMHMDHHMAEKLMEEEKQFFQIEFQAKKQNLINMKTSAKTTNINKTKSVKRKSAAVDNNCSISSFLTNTKELNKENEEMKQCPECDKNILANDFACHLDFHAAKKLHLELNPVKYGSKTENISMNNNNKKKNCKNTNGMISISNFFKTVEN